MAALARFLGLSATGEAPRKAPFYRTSPEPEPGPAEPGPADLGGDFIPLRAAASPQQGLDWAESPWSRRRFERGEGYSDNRALKLHAEVQDFAEFIAPSAAELLMREEVVGRLTDIIVGLWPEAEVKLFGSVASGLLLPTSDVDMVVFGEWPTLPLKTLAAALERAKCTSRLKVIATARVPIIKLRDAATSVDVDISFNMPGGPEEAVRIQQYLQTFPALKPLVMVIKQFLAQRQLNDVFTGGARIVRHPAHDPELPAAPPARRL